MRPRAQDGSTPARDTADLDLSENDRLRPVDQHAVLEHVAHGRASTVFSTSRPSRTMSSTVSVWSTRITSCSMIGPRSRLGGDEVARRPDQLHPVVERPLVRAAPGEGRQEAVVDVHQPAGEAGAEARRGQHLHEPREHDQLRLLRVSNSRSIVGNACPFRRRDRHVINGTPRAQRLPRRPRGSRRPRAGRRRAHRSATVQQIGEAVAPPRLARTSDPLRHARVADRELHRVPAREREEAALQPLDAEGERVGRDHVAHEEAASRRGPSGSLPPSASRPTRRRDR